METINLRSYKDIKNAQKTVLVLGYFDGIHLGHKALFDRARAIADEQGLTVTVLTFPESPKIAFTRFIPDLLLQLTYPEHRAQLLADYGVDNLYLVDFTSEFAAQTPQEFVQHYVKNLNAQVVVAGFDYHFGKGRAAVQDLSDYFDGQIEIIDQISFDQEKISSSRIRAALAQGQVGLANQLLGYTYSTEGIVVHGDARGRTIGFPTANLAPIHRTHLPSDGVYVADVELDGKRYRAMASVGKNVTFDGTELRLEAHIFDFEKDIYGQKIKIFWLEKIREMIKFEGIEGLMTQMQSDQDFAKKWDAKKSCQAL